MNFAIIRTSLLEKIKTNIFSYEDIIIFVNDLITHLGINDYLKEIRFLPSTFDADLVIYKCKDQILRKDTAYKNDKYVIKNSVNILATYSFFERVMKIDIDNIIREAKDYFDNDESELILFINMSIIECLIHETVHAYQNFAIHETNYSLYQLMALELPKFELMDDDQYDKYYNTFIFEREAIITTYEAIMIISKVFFA